jgi:hypothetical protein
MNVPLALKSITMHNCIRHNKVWDYCCDGFLCDQNMSQYQCCLLPVPVAEKLDALFVSKAHKVVVRWFFSAYSWCGLLLQGAVCPTHSDVLCGFRRDAHSLSFTNAGTSQPESGVRRTHVVNSWPQLCQQTCFSLEGEKQPTGCGGSTGRVACMWGSLCHYAPVLACSSSPPPSLSHSLSSLLLVKRWICWFFSSVVSLCEFRI